MPFEPEMPPGFMPDPITLTCVGCGASFVCDQTSEAAKDKLCRDCAVPGARGL